LNDIAQNGIQGLNELIPGAKRIVIHLGTGWHRTEQTVRAYETYLRKMGYGDKIAAFYIPAYEALGSEEMFARMESDTRLVEVAETKGWTYAIINANGAYYDDVRLDFRMAMNDILECLEDGDLCISAGHNGIMETFGNFTNPKFIPETLNLKELAGIILYADKSGYKNARIIGQEND
jgi:hypothetical protein